MMAAKHRPIAELIIFMWTDYQIRGVSQLNYLVILGLFVLLSGGRIA